MFRDQLGSLPLCLLQKIADEVIAFGRQDAHSLRSCSRYLRPLVVLCNAETTTASFPARDLEAALPFLSALPKLDSVTIRGDTDEPRTLDSQLLGSLVARLTRLELNGGPDQLRIHHHVMVVEGIGDVLRLPSLQTLRRLRVENCTLSTNGSNGLNGPGLFDGLQSLRSLHLVGIHAPDGAGTVLDLMGCTALRKLYCQKIHLASLESMVACHGEITCVEAQSIYF